MLPNDVSLTDDVESYDESDDDDDGIDRTEQIFNFVDVPSFISFLVAVQLSLFIL